MDKDYGPHLIVKKEEHILWIWLNRPEASNAYSMEMVEAIPRALLSANQDPEIRVIILGAHGKQFCAGGDVKAMKEQTGMFAGDAFTLRNQYTDGIQAIPRAMMNVRCPVIGMIQGAAVGAGCDLVAMTDIRVASSAATFAETFCQVGLVPGDAGAWFMTKAVGATRAQEMFLLGKTYSAEEAKQMGLVHFVVSAQELKDEAYKLAQTLISQSPVALQLTKKALQMAFETTLLQHLDLSSAYQAIAQRSNEHFESINKTFRVRK